MFYSLKSRLIAFFVLLLVVSFGTMSFMLFSQSRDIIRSYIESSALEKMDEYGSFVSTAALQMYDLASLVYNSEETKKWDRVLSDPAESEGEKMLANIALSDFLTHAANSYSGVSSVTLYRKDGVTVSDGKQIGAGWSYADADWYTNYAARDNHWVPAHQDEIELKRSRSYPFISLLLPIGEFELTRGKTVMKINVGADFFLEPLSRIHLGDKGTIFLLDEAGKPMLSQERYAPGEAAQQEIGRIHRSSAQQGVAYLHSPGSGDTDILVYKKLKQNGWMLAGFVPEADLYAKLYKLRMTIVIFASFLLLAAILLATWLSYGISKPLSRLASAMRLVQKGEFAAAAKRIESAGVVKNEVGFVTSSFSTMVSQLDSHIKTEFEQKLLRQQAEYKALLMQINPHFLFNTLELLSSLSMQRRADDSVTVIESLGKMLRFSLNSSEDLIPLKDELAYLRYYVSILEIRFRERLQVTVETIGDPAGRQIVKFLLQPLVENAVKYSFLARETAEVGVTVLLEPERVRLIVSDNGPGIPEELTLQLQEETVRSRLHDVLNAGGGPIGLRNVLARCSLYYGSGFAYDIRATGGEGAEQGTTIELILPIKEGTCHV